METYAIPALVVTVAITVLGVLLKRSIDAIDAKLLELTIDLKGMTKSLNEHDVQLVELKVRVAHIEAERAEERRKLDDMGGFLQGLGFRKRDGG